MSANQTAILVVEDDTALREFLTSALADQPHRTVTAVSNGAEALAYLDSVHPQLIALDTSLPGIDGIAVKEIRERAAFNGVPVLLLSARSRQHLTSLGGWFTWMSKSFNVAELRATVDALLAGR